MKRLIAIALVMLVSLPGVACATTKRATTTELYTDYSMMFSRSAGQYWSSGSVAGQWAWAPQSSTESWVYWGSPAAWPPAYHERFLLSGDWVMLDGWWDNGHYYTDRTTTEYQADANCSTNKINLPLGSQHYTHQTIPAASYCLYAEGVITESVSGLSEHYKHQQVWSLAGSCSNAYQPAKPCLRQDEQWSDDSTGVMMLKVNRSGYQAKGAGLAWKITQSYPAAWSADLRYEWLY